ncbi:MBL fold metallo-hydrolase [Trichloromonas sp.]|uniref:MBL fold metallo-hydrolase n=1 Tax=Trichloromonas sp. TaxID=3069249 RepID=UPI003D81A6D0
MRSVFFPRLVNGPFGDPALYVYLSHRGEALLFDCGDLHALSIRELLKLKAVFISHGHIDHVVGLDALLRAFLCLEAELLVCGPPGLADQIAGRLSGYTWNLVEGYSFTLIVREWGESGGRQVRFRAANAFHPEDDGRRFCPEGLLYETAACRVRGVPLDHGGIISLAFVLEEPLHVAIHKDALERLGYRPGPWLTDFKDRLRGPDASGAVIEVPLSGGGSTAVELSELAGRIAHCERGMKICYVTDASPSDANLERIAVLATDAHLLVIEAVFSHQEL